MDARPTSFYLDKQNAKWLGVCAGMAEYTGIDVSVIRIVTVLGTIFGSGTLLFVYLVIAWMANSKPAGLYHDEDEAKFWQGVRQSPSRTATDVRAKFRDIDRRLADVETYYTSRNTALADEIDSLR
jgi:phage shock protein C